MGIFVTIFSQKANVLSGIQSIEMEIYVMKLVRFS